MPINPITAGRLRLILASVVLLHHTLGFFGLGASAVYLFFLLSGYWISKLWQTEYSNSSFPISRYYFSRWMRLAPILTCISLLAIAAHYYYPRLFSINPAETYLTMQWWLVTLSMFGITNQPLLITPAWSLAVEMQFYLLFPLLALLLAKSEKSLVILFVFSITYGTFAFTTGTSAITGNVLIFLPYFLAGIYHYRSPIRISARTTFLATTVYFVLTLAFAANTETRFIINNYPGKTAWMTVIQNLWFYLSTFLLAPLAFTSVVQNSSKFDRMLGNLAYPLYLFHSIPVAFYYQFRDQLEIPKTFLVLGCWLASAIGALLIYFLVDRPFEKLRKLLSHYKFQKNYDQKF